MLQVYKNNHCSLIKAAPTRGESKESQKQHLLRDTLAQPKVSQVICLSYLTSFCSSGCFLTCVCSSVDTRHRRPAGQWSTVRRSCCFSWATAGASVAPCACQVLDYVHPMWVVEQVRTRHKVHVRGQELAVHRDRQGKARRRGWSCARAG